MNDILKYVVGALIGLLFGYFKDLWLNNQKNRQHYKIKQKYFNHSLNRAQKDADVIYASINSYIEEFTLAKQGVIVDVAVDNIEVLSNITMKEEYFIALHKVYKHALESELLEAFLDVQYSACFLYKTFSSIKERSVSFNISLRDMRLMYRDKAVLLQNLILFNVDSSKDYTECVQVIKEFTQRENNVSILDVHDHLVVKLIDVAKRKNLPEFGQPLSEIFGIYADMHAQHKAHLREVKEKLKGIEVHKEKLKVLSQYFNNGQVSVG